MAVVVAVAEVIVVLVMTTIVVVVVSSSITNITSLADGGDVGSRSDDSIVIMVKGR